MRKVAGRLQRVTCPLCNLSRNFLWFAKLHKVELGSNFFNDCMEFILNRLQLVIATCNRSATTCNEFLFPTFREELQEKLHRVTSACSVQSSQAQKSGKISCKKGMLSLGLHIVVTIAEHAFDVVLKRI